MDVKLYKKQVELKDGKKFYTFYLKLENGSILRVNADSWEDKNGNKHSNYNELLLIAFDELPFDK